MAETTTERKPRPFRFGMRAIAALGIGLGLGAMWWRHSDNMLAYISQLLGVPL